MEEKEKLPQLFSDDELDAVLKGRDDCGLRDPGKGAWDSRSSANVLRNPPPTDGRPESTLEQRFTHIVKQVVALWPSEACAMYLNNLLVANREGRQGFPQEVVEDLMMLYNVNEIGKTMRKSLFGPGR